MMDQWIAKISQKDAFHIVKNTYVSLTIWIVALSLLYVFSNVFRIHTVQEWIIYILEHHYIFFGTVFGYQFTKQKQMDPVLGILTGILCGFVTMICFQSNLWMSIPNMLIIAFTLQCIRIVDKRKISISWMPPAVCQYIKNLMIPITVFIVLAMVTCIPSQFMDLLLEPLRTVVYALSTLPAILLVIGLTCYFWIRGIHGVAILGTILRPFWMQMILMNLYAVLMHQPVVYIGSEAFFQWFVWIGGSGATLGLAIVCSFFGRSQHMKAVKKTALSGGIFNINEQVIFGMPIMENRYLMLPFFGVPLISACIAYTLMQQGTVGICHVLAPWVAPFFLGSILSAGASAKILLLSFGLVLLSALCYLPFFVWYDKKLKEGE